MPRKPSATSRRSSTPRSRAKVRAPKSSLPSARSRKLRAYKDPQKDLLETRARDLLQRTPGVGGSPPVWEILAKKNREHPKLQLACDVFSWMESYLKIRTKKPVRVWNAERGCYTASKLAPFRMNAVQRQMAQYIAKCYVPPEELRDLL